MKIPRERETPFAETLKFSSLRRWIDGGTTERFECKCMRPAPHPRSNRGEARFLCCQPSEPDKGGGNRYLCLSERGRGRGRGRGGRCSPSSSFGGFSQNAPFLRGAHSAGENNSSSAWKQVSWNTELGNVSPSSQCSHVRKESEKKRG